MNEQTEKLLRELAAQFGTTVEHLWQVLVKQAAIEGVTGVLLWVFLGVFLLWCFTKLKWLTTTPPATPEKRHPEPPVDFEIGVIMWGAFAIFSGICLICFADSFSDVVACFLNPEYWALKQIIK